jgi:F-type H+-transporting ATPase subunit b
VFALVIGFACSPVWANAESEPVAAEPSADVEDAVHDHGDHDTHAHATEAEESDAPTAVPADHGDHGAGAHGEAGHGDDHGHHDPHDLSHANASPALQQPEEWRYDMALCTFAVFVLLLALMRIFAWGPIMDGLEKREKSIAARIEDAERSAQEAAEKLQEYETKLAGAADEGAQIVEKARRDAEAVAEKVRVAAQEDATKERQRAIADIREAKNVAIREVSHQAADMAVLLAGRIVRREVRADDHTTLITEALEQLPSKN